MASLLLVTNGLPGMLYSSIELARRLQATGHRVVYCTVEDARDRVTRSGITFRPLPSTGWQAFVDEDRRHGFPRRLLRLAARRRAAVDALSAAPFDRLLQEIDPDLVLLDGELHEQVIIACSAGRDVALLNTFVSMWRLPGMPPPHCFVIPGSGFWGSAAGIFLLWSAASVRKAVGRWRHKVRAVGCDRVSVLRRLAARHGFDFRRRVDFRQWLKPFTYRGLPVLSLHALEFEFPHRPPAAVHYLGPQVPSARSDASADDPEMQQIRRIIEAVDRDTERTLVYVGFGSFFTVDSALLSRLMEALGRRDEWQVILSLGGDATFARDALPQNVAAFPWVPQLEVLRAADVMIGHGGINSVDECVLAGVPMLVYPGPETDMAGTAARVAYHGIGIVGDADGDGPDDIEARVAGLLREKRFAENVARLRSAYVAYRVDRVAERAVAALLSPAARESARR